MDNYFLQGLLLERGERSVVMIVLIRQKDKKTPLVKGV